MKRTMYSTLVALALAASARADSPPDLPKTPAAAGETARPTTEKTDDESARIVAELLRSKLSKDPKQLADMARERGQLAIAEFEYGRHIALCRARERRLEDRLVELRKHAEQATAERAHLRGQLDKEMAQIKQRFHADDAECERQLTVLLNACAPRLQQLRTDAQHSTELAEKATAKLEEVRREGLALEQHRRLAAQGLPRTASRIRLVDLELEDAPTTRTEVQKESAPKPDRSVAERLKELDD